MLKQWTRIAWEWGVRCFGEDHMRDPRVRALRLLEEAMEYAQACDVSIEAANKVRDHVWSRPKGGRFQELGGVMVTALVAAAGNYFNVEEVMEEEILRCLSKSPEHFAKRNQEKIDAGLR